jgi:hypothetical protein
VSVTPAQIQSLYNATKQAANRFASYGFRQHFQTRTDEVFQPVLASSSTDLSQFYHDKMKDLHALKRAAEVNRMYEGPKLVVEHARPITGGGGAGAEASFGGGGQPDKGPKGDI